MTQTALAGVLGRDRSLMSRWERGQSIPPLLVGIKLARELDTLTESLYWSFYSKDPRR